MTKSESPDSMKSLFEYDNYRMYLRDYYHFAKTKSSKFSYRYFARLGGFKSGNILKIVIDGEINIKEDTIAKFCKALKLNKEESLFFKNLVFFNQAASSSEKVKYSKELLRSKTYQKINPLSEAQYRYFDLWYYPVIRSLVVLQDFKEEPLWIAQKINPPITPREAKEAIDNLLALGLLSRNETGQLVKSNPTITTTNNIISSSLAHYHREMMKKASESIDRHSRDRRDLSVLTLEVSEESIKIIKELSEKFRKDIIEIVSKENNPDQIFQLSTYLFPATQERDQSDEGEIP